MTKHVSLNSAQCPSGSIATHTTIHIIPVNLIVTKHVSLNSTQYPCGSIATYTRQDSSYNSSQSDCEQTCFFKFC